MLRPSYTELMDIVNQDAEADDMITSRYSIVIAAAKRARQIVDGAPHYAPAISSDKAVSVAINEMENGKLKIFPEGLDESAEAQYRRAFGRAGQGMALSADVISSKDFDEEDELFADADDGEMGKAYAEMEGEDDYDEFSDNDSEFGFSDEDEDMEIDGDNLDFK